MNPSTVTDDVESHAKPCALQSKGMPRRSKTPAPPSTGPSPGGIPHVPFDDPALEELANQRHPMNVLVNEYDWQRALEAARSRSLTSASDIVRIALGEFLDREGHAAHLRQVAEMALRFEVEASRARRSFGSQPAPS